MDSDEVNFDQHLLETSPEHFMSLDSSGEDFPEDVPAPRIGELYQAVLPTLQQESYSLEHTQIFDGGDTSSKWIHHPGLAVPISWVSGPAFRNTAKKNYKSSRPIMHRANNPVYQCISFQAIECITEDTDDPSHHAMLLQHTTSSNQLNVDNTQSRRSIICTPLPYGCSNPWNDDDIEIFVLGLYIFGKNLIHLQKFVECKMGDILSFYYGKFYMSEAHRKWLECKKSKGRKQVLGHHLLASWRQQELLSRLSQKMSEESQKLLSKATKTFNENGMSLEMYAFTLKDIVGAKSLAAAVGIGNGKYDLTSILVDPGRGNQIRSFHSEMPMGKACSYLTDAEIIKFLTGDYRLSKARSNDLFWEAVWPRLLARGWNSEQPKDQTFAASKQTLVFLAPGIKKFSRRKLTKGEHYFDSLTDVLKKVASDPKILELGSEYVSSTFVSSASRSGRALQKGPESDHGDAVDRCHEDLCPKSSRFTSCLMRFTVVDTSLVQGEAPFHVRELRSLPMANPSTCLCSSPLNETDGNSPRDHQNPTDELPCDQQKQNSNATEDHKLRNKARHIFERGIKLDNDDLFTSCNPNSDKACSTIGSRDQKLKRVEKEKVKFDRFLDYKVAVPKRKRAFSEVGTSSVQHPTKCNKELIKHQFTRRRKTGKSNFMSPISNKSAITCSNSENDISSLLTRNHWHNGKARSKAFDTIVNLAEDLCQPHCKPCGSLGEKGKISGQVQMKERLQQGGFIDLNLPQFPPEINSHRKDPTETPIRQSLDVNAVSSDDFLRHEACSQSDTQHQSDMNLRKPSTGVRPITTHAMQAVESGFLNIKRRARGYRFPTSDVSTYLHHTGRTIEASISLMPGNCSGNEFEIADTKSVKKDQDCTGYPNETTFSSKSQFEVANA